MRATGTAQADHVLVANEAEANRLHNKGHFGAPQTGNSLRLDWVEAAYLVDADRLDVAGAGVADLLAHGGPGAEARYLVYRDLRERGLVVRASNDLLTAWNRGQGPSAEPWFTTRAFAERNPVEPADVFDGETFSVVDEDGQVTHYQARALAPAGHVHANPFPSGTGRRLGDHVQVTDDALVAELAKQYLGIPHGDGRLLSLVEAHHLGVALDLDDDLDAIGPQLQPQFEAVQPVHDALRAAGVVTRSGFRFGTHLRGYEGDPDDGHAPWLFHCVRTDDVMSWPALSRGIRLAHGVRKDFVIAWADEPVRFRALSWFRP